MVYWEKCRAAPELHVETLSYKASPLQRSDGTNSVAPSDLIAVLDCFQMTLTEGIPHSQVRHLVANRVEGDQRGCPNSAQSVQPSCLKATAICGQAEPRKRPRQHLETSFQVAV